MLGWAYLSICSSNSRGPVLGKVEGVGSGRAFSRERSSWLFFAEDVVAQRSFPAPPGTTVAFRTCSRKGGLSVTGRKYKRVGTVSIQKRSAATESPSIALKEEVEAR